MRASVLALLAAALVAAPASAQAGTLLSVPVAGGKATVVARDAGAYFGTPCRRGDGALTALVERKRGGRQYLLARAGAAPRWRTTKEELLEADFAPGCELVSELYYAFPDGEPDSGVLIRDAAGKELARFKAPDPEELPTVAWSPDGSRIALAGWETSHDETIRILDAHSGRLIARRRVQQVTLSAQPFSPDGSALVYEQVERLLVLDANTGNARVLAGKNDGRRFRAPAWSPKGDRIAAVNDGGGIELLDPQLGYGPVVPTSPLFTEDIVWSPDASTLALRFSQERPGTTRWGLALVTASPQGRPRQPIPASQSLTLPVWAPDSASLAVAR